MKLRLSAILLICLVLAGFKYSFNYPPKVTSTLEEYGSTSEISNENEFEEDGVTYYEFTLKKSNKEIFLKIDENGKLIEHDESDSESSEEESDEEE